MKADTANAATEAAATVVSTSYSTNLIISKCAAARHAVTIVVGTIRGGAFIVPKTIVIILQTWRSQSPSSKTWQIMRHGG